ncbi:biliverdin-producing heme oxygenase [Qipengyuania sp. MTN3-11]|uniref:biliverdin-producing heme oxygenase n=1 Tax=Qipengyuania sp. MTN3-11 TaxID=3056557 RepID=UPI0036F405C5
MKRSTRSVHDALDRKMGADGAADGRAYADFLAVQYSARLPLEDWIAGNCPPDLEPPAQSPLIADDLSALGRDLPPPVPLAPLDGADWRGIAWALGGSSLGNRAMLVRRRKLAASGPDRFLSDPAMPRYFRRLLPILERPVPSSQEEAAVAAALRVFDAFETALKNQAARLAA